MYINSTSINNLKFLLKKKKIMSKLYCLPLAAWRLLCRACVASSHHMVFINIYFFSTFSIFFPLASLTTTINIIFSEYRTGILFVYLYFFRAPTREKIPRVIFGPRLILKVLPNEKGRRAFIH